MSAFSNQCPSCNKFVNVLTHNAVCPHGELTSVWQSVFGQSVQTFVLPPADPTIEFLKGAVEQLVSEVARLHKDNEALKERVVALEENVEELNWRLDDATVCRECGGEPCDCNQEIWTFKIRYPDGQEAWNNSGDPKNLETRPYVLHQLKTHEEDFKKWGWRVSPPLRRETDPMFVFPDED